MDLAGPDLTTAKIDLSAPPGSGVGDGSPDTVIANGTNGPDDVHVGSADGSVVVSGLAAEVRVAGGEAASDKVNVNTLGGDDTVTNGTTTSGPAAINVDGGAGSDTAPLPMM